MNRWIRAFIITGTAFVCLQAGPVARAYNPVVVSAVLLTATATNASEPAAVSPTVLPRFRDVVRADSVIAQFDAETLTYEPDPYRQEKLLQVWVKLKSDSYSGDYVLEQHLLRMTKPEMMVLRKVSYSAAGELLHEEAVTYSPEAWKPIFPDTPEEACYRAITAYAKEHAKAVKAQADKQKKPVDSVRELLGGVADMLGIG